MWWCWSDKRWVSVFVGLDVSSLDDLSSDRRRVRLLLTPRTRQLARNQFSNLSRVCLVSVGRVDLQATHVSIGWKLTVGNLTQQDMWRSSEWQTLVATSVARVTDTSGDPTFWNTRAARDEASVLRWHTRARQSWVNEELGRRWVSAINCTSEVGAHYGIGTEGKAEMATARA
jgi:hypothetical protein